jgi:hypothetical protein
MPSAPASIEGIEETLAQSIDCNRARVKFLARFLIALFTVKSVCLTQIASVFPGEAQVGSHYKRLQRFLRGFEMDFATLARLLVRLSGAAAPFELALDRTDWKLGRVHLNLLMLVIVHQGIGFPVVWCVRGKEPMGFVCADREFASQGLLAWLVEQKKRPALQSQGTGGLGTTFLPKLASPARATPERSPPLLGAERLCGRNALGGRLPDYHQRSTRCAFRLCVALGH